MKEILDNIADFIKKLMQPMLTFVAVLVFFMYSGKQWFTSEQVFWVVGGIILFWFGYTAIKNFNYNGTDESKKADALALGNTGKVAGWGDPCPNCDTDNATDYSGYTPEVATAEDDGDKVSDIINGIFDESKADGLKSPTTAYVASHIVSWLGAHEDELTDDEKEELINYGINYATDAYKTTTGLTKLPTAKESAQFNTWWLNNKVACKAPKGEARAVFMILRDLMTRQAAL